MSLKIICVEFENLKLFENGTLRIDFVATDRVFKDSGLFKISGNVVTQNVIGFIGLNATGKTTVLRLLKTALEIVIRNTDLNEAITSNFMVDGTVIRTTFFHKGVYYQLESVVGCREDEGKRKFYYRDETLKTKENARISSRAKLTDFSEAHIEHRIGIEKNVAKYLDESKSIVGPIAKDSGSYVSDNMWTNYVNASVFSGKTPSEILEVFDDSIEYFSMTKVAAIDEPIKWKLKFKHDTIEYSSTDILAPNLLLSTGTISGQKLLSDAVVALKRGGYLFVDELEAHLNRELVRVVLGLFTSQKTNPHGACIIFSTHYTEILDFSVLNRKDNIYITRKKNYLLSARKFSTEFKRNDFKKSEIFMSNLLTGTAPKYEAIERLREYVCNQIR